MSKSYREDLTGQRFGRLTVIEFVPNNKPNSYWKCRCDCGRMVIINAGELKRGSTNSCGCLRRERAIILNKTQNRIHGLYKTKLYRKWEKMKTRCYNKNNNFYKDYGGRGITVCEEWKNDFKAFYDWSLEHGYKEGLSIDRIDVNGDYCPANCRFTDIKTQNRNKRNNIMVEYHGNQVCLKDAAELSEINRNTLQHRYHNGERGERLFRPVKKKSK